MALSCAKPGFTFSRAKFVLVSIPVSRTRESHSTVSTPSHEKCVCFFENYTFTLYKRKTSLVYVEVCAITRKVSFMTVFTLSTIRQKRRQQQHHTQWQTRSDDRPRFLMATRRHIRAVTRRQVVGKSASRSGTEKICLANNYTTQAPLTLSTGHGQPTSGIVTSIC